MLLSLQNTQIYIKIKMIEEFLADDSFTRRQLAIKSAALPGVKDQRKESARAEAFYFTFVAARA
jgi:hypothetical protein